MWFTSFQYSGEAKLTTYFLPHQKPTILPYFSCNNIKYSWRLPAFPMSRRFPILQLYYIMWPSCCFLLKESLQQVQSAQLYVGIIPKSWELFMPKIKYSNKNLKVWVQANKPNQHCVWITHSFRKIFVKLLKPRSSRYLRYNKFCCKSQSPFHRHVSQLDNYLLWVWWLFSWNCWTFWSSFLKETIDCIFLY